MVEGRLCDRLSTINPGAHHSRSHPLIIHNNGSMVAGCAALLQSLLQGAEAPCCLTSRMIGLRWNCGGIAVESGLWADLTTYP
ncbi:MAG: hypothetical protein EA001_10620 [Oscillatoriales cyanobacterium]|nr:MAG: hypothetical protein EA001_10620 [Oscillatoriales cyanobacterium]